MALPLVGVYRIAKVLVKIGRYIIGMRKEAPPILRKEGPLMCLHFEQNHEKATQVLNSMAARSGGSIDKITALKLVFFADRYHIRKYGRPIIGDEYFAMPKGPVPSMAKDIAEKSDELDESEREYVDKYLSVSCEDYKITSIAPVDNDVFSDSDLEALDFSWETFGGFGKRVINISHAYPEWNKFRERLEKKEVKRCLMDYADFFLDADPKSPDLWQLGYRDVFQEVISSEEKEDALELARERFTIRTLWNK